MPVFFYATEQMLILVILLVAGVIARRCKLMNDKFDTMLSALVMNVALPAMILGSVLGNESLPSGRTIGTILLCSACAFVIIILVSELIPRLLYRKLNASAKATHSFMIAFGNVGFIGLPVLGALFGPQAVFYGAVNNIPYNLAMFTVGKAMFNRASNSSESHISVLDRVKATIRSLVNPCMVASFASVALALLGITDTEGIIGQSCEYLGQFTLPASMLIVGSSLAKMSLKSMIGHFLPYVSSFGRLVLVPLIMYGVFHFFVADSLVLGVLVVGSAMPVATMGAMFCLVYKGDLETMMRGTFISTVFSIITIPLVSLLVL